ncbi:MAG: acyltransferase [Rhodobacteraceae bacterium]|nr:acyltransferase [Paracoccaceae bacterium]
MERRYDLDWLRILLFALLVWHHAAVGFADFGARIYGFANNQLGGELLSLGIYFSHSWRLPSLFLISGIGTYFATRGGVGGRFMGTRLARLLIPALFGAFLLNLATGYVIAHMQGYGGGFWPLALRWWTEPELHQVMHLWFLVNLAIYTLLCWPLYLLRERLTTSSLGAPWLLLLLAAGVTLIAIIFKPYGAAIAGDGYQFPWYLGIFAAGYVIGARHRDVLAWSGRHAFWLIGAGVLLFLTEVTLLVIELEKSQQVGLALAEGGWATAKLAPAYGAIPLTFATVEGLNAWAWLLAATGLAARYLNHPGPLLIELSRAVFPFYVLHFPVTIAGLAVAAQLDWPWGWEFLLLSLGVYIVTAALYVAATFTGPAIYLIGGRSN